MNKTVCDIIDDKLYQLELRKELIVRKESHCQTDIILINTRIDELRKIKLEIVRIHGEI